MQQKRELATSVETPVVDVRTRTKQLGAKEKARRKQCEVRFSLIRRIRVFQKNYTRIGAWKLMRTGALHLKGVPGG